MSVVEALQFTAAQKQKLRLLQDEGYRKVNTMFQLKKTPETMHRDAEALWLKIHEQFLASLTAEQYTRWQGLMGQPFHGTIRTPAIVFGGHFHFPGMGGPGGPKDKGKSKKGPPPD